uniref:Uncharacterized protein n=1 Tax=Arundo donax TaxID=35708 RepID=A0A0A9DUI2_ARUDO
MLTPLHWGSSSRAPGIRRRGQRAPSQQRIRAPPLRRSQTRPAGSGRQRGPETLAYPAAVAG